MNQLSFELRAATVEDAETIAALSVQVFLDTYATEGVRPDLAQEAMSEYSVAAFTDRLREPGRTFVVAEVGTGLIGFAEIQTLEARAPVGDVSGAQLVRLYIQPAVQGHGVGRALIQHAETIASTHSKALWLTAWEKNDRALAFYTHLGYADVGADTYTFRGHTYGTRVLAKTLLRSTP